MRRNFIYLRFMQILRFAQNDRKEFVCRFFALLRMTHGVNFAFCTLHFRLLPRGSCHACVTEGVRFCTLHLLVILEAKPKDPLTVRRNFIYLRFMQILRFAQNDRK